MVLHRVRGECGRSAYSCRSGAVGARLAGSGLPCVEDSCEPIQVQCSWSSSAHLSVCASQRLREPTCCVAFTGAGLLPVEPVEGVSTLLAAPLLLGCVLSLLCVSPCVPVRCARDAELSRCLACCVAPLVERCNTYLWLLSAWCWLVVSSSEVLLEFFSVGSGLFRARFCCCGATSGFEVCCWLGWCVLEGFSQNDALVVLVESCFVLFWLSLLSLSLCEDELSLFPVGLSLLQSAWAFSVKVLCPWPCVWLLHWPACLVVRFQVFSAVLADFVCPCGLGGLLCSCARRALADGGLVSVVVLGCLCFVWKCQSRVVVLPLACGRDSCVSPSSTFRRLLGVVVLHYGVMLPECASL
ncbi:hypothetical protein Taro_046448 [Colocasia esculenta]|uniref:Uncharacterized protein n=1 Tax=Colocasia esculenta TaxID=4460 RepID=A0A843WPY3_COLES|nr:hypothetical protein [Colocasia esculenta]